MILESQILEISSKIYDLIGNDHFQAASDLMKERSSIIYQLVAQGVVADYEDCLKKVHALDAEAVSILKQKQRQVGKAIAGYNQLKSYVTV